MFKLFIVLTVITSSLVLAINEGVKSSHSINITNRASQSIQVNNCKQPPSNLNIDSLTPVQLETYGLPARPTDPHMLSFWKNIVSHAKHHVCSYFKGKSPIGHPIAHGNRVLNNSTAIGTNSNVWAGNADISDQNYEHLNFTSVTGYITLSEANVPNNSEYAAWTGLGGDNCSNNLIQSGGQILIDQYGNVIPDMWVENVPQSPYYANTPVYANDVLATESDNSNGAYTFVEDVTRSSFFSSKDASGFITSVSGTSCSADFIVENEIPQGIQLANFGYIPFSQSYWYATPLYGTLGSIDHDYFIMCNGSTFNWLDPCSYGGHVIASPGPISSDGSSFQVNFIHST